MSSLNERIARSIRHFRVQQRLSQDSLAARCGLDRTYISGIERCVRNITINSLEKIIVNGLSISTSTFFSFVEELHDNVQDK